MKTKSRWSNWSSGTEIKKGFHNIFFEASGNPEAPGYKPSRITSSETDTGNPTGTGAVSPAEKARQMGLQSNGHGSYLDPATGEIVARTVNGELVFYDHRGATGGVVSDGSGGASLTQAAPSWRDPDTGMIIVPPAKPESPQELAVVPDPTPATPPMGYDKFMHQKKTDAHKKNMVNDNIQQDIDQQTNDSLQYIAKNPLIQSKYDHLIQKEESTKQEIDNALIIGDYVTATERQEFLDKVIDYRLHMLDDAEDIHYNVSLIPPEQGEQYLDLHQKSFLNRRKQYQIQAEFDNTKNSKMLEDDEKNLTLKKLFRTASKYGERASIQEDEMDNMVRHLGGQTRDQVVGNHTTYNLGQSNTSDAMEGIQKSLKSYGVDPEQAFSMTVVSWDTNINDNLMIQKYAEVKGISPEKVNKNDEEYIKFSDRLYSLDALKTWRNKVLPKFKDGEVLYNDPISYHGEQNRARIYELAGFGSNSSGGQYALVKKDEYGINHILPLEYGDTPTPKRKKKTSNNKRK